MKKENNDKTSQEPSLNQKDKEIKKRMEEHPYETMSQVENRYGNGRENNGSDGPHLSPPDRNH